MSELRYDPLFGQWTCIAERRQERPFEFQQITQRRGGIDCPFCRGNEAVTPPAISEWSNTGTRLTNGSDWQVRVLPNKYPALDSSLIIRQPQNGTDTKNRISIASDEKLSFQEVIVLTPRHVVSLSGLRDDELDTSFSVFQDRVAAHFIRPSIEHVCLFMNCRPMAGASIEHVHFQLMASPICTNQVRQRVERMEKDNAWEKRLAWEAESETRIVEKTDEFLVFCPYASRFSNQIRIAPLPGKSAADESFSPVRFPDWPKGSLGKLARLCRKWIDGIERCLDHPAYNLIFHFPPTDSTQTAWFIDLVPRFPQAAGFELATDCWVNPVSPETAAAQFRQFDQHEES